MATDGGQDVCVEGAVRGSVSFGMPRKMYRYYLYDTMIDYDRVYLNQIRFRLPN